jgi:hypothetical protein
MKTILSNRQRKQAVKRFPKQARQEHLITPQDILALPKDHEPRPTGLTIPTRIID